MKTEPNKPALIRVIGLPLFTFYGMSAIPGVGIYVLAGPVAMDSGERAVVAK